MRKYSQKMSGEKSKISKANIDNNKSLSFFETAEQIKQFILKHLFP